MFMNIFPNVLLSLRVNLKIRGKEVKPIKIY